MFGDVTNHHVLLCDMKLLLMLIENNFLEVSLEECRITSVSITLL